MSKQNTNNFSLMDFVDEENDRQMRELEGKVAELTQMVSSSSEINKQIETEKNEAISELKTLKNEFNTLSPKTSFSVSLFNTLNPEDPVNPKTPKWGPPFERYKIEHMT